MEFIYLANLPENLQSIPSLLLMAIGVGALLCLLVEGAKREPSAYILIIPLLAVLFFSSLMNQSISTAYFSIRKDMGNGYYMIYVSSHYAPIGIAFMYWLFRTRQIQKTETIEDSP